MIPDVSVSVYGLVQFTITVITIQLVLVRFPLWIVFLSFIPGQWVWETPPCGGVVLSHERQKKYTIFHLQFQPFLTKQRSLADYIPSLKDGVLSARLIT